MILTGRRYVAWHTRRFELAAWLDPLDLRVGADWGRSWRGRIAWVRPLPGVVLELEWIDPWAREPHDGPVEF